MIYNVFEVNLDDFHDFNIRYGSAFPKMMMKERLNLWLVTKGLMHDYTAEDVRPIGFVGFSYWEHKPEREYVQVLTEDEYSHWKFKKERNRARQLYERADYRYRAP